jgi:serine phosphatase RsbU (regulator of sigma subunit)
VVRTQSMTSGASFQARLAHAETWRSALVGACFTIVLGTWLARRLIGGTDGAADAVFYPTVWLLSVSVVILSFGFIDARRHASRGLPLPAWRLVVGTVIDALIPFGLLLILHVRSPLGDTISLTSPALMLYPIVILLSVLRLRVGFTALLGCLAAFSHAALVLDTYRRGHIDPHGLPRALTYAMLLAMTGVAASVLAHFVRAYIMEAILESQAAERANRSLASVEHELGIARDIQMSLLPVQPPDLPGFDVAGMARPAAHAGGDYYDWQMLADGRCVVAVADVTGHGIGPALVMAVCRAYARATVPTVASAEQFLERINALVSKDLTTGRFITMAVAVVSPDGRIDLLSAGHGPTFLYRAATRAVERFGGNGLPLGIMEDERYSPTMSVTLSRGDVMVLLTDGFMERASADGKMFGINRLAAIVAASGDRPAKEIIRLVDADVSAFGAGAPQGDDMTIVVLKRTGA